MVPGACLRPRSRPCRRPDSRLRVHRLSRPGRSETPSPSFPAAHQGPAKGLAYHPTTRIRRNALARTVAKAPVVLWRGKEAGPEPPIAAVTSRLPSAPGAVFQVTTHSGCLVCT